MFSIKTTDGNTTSIISSVIYRFPVCALRFGLSLFHPSPVRFFLMQQTFCPSPDLSHKHLICDYFTSPRFLSFDGEFSAFILVLFASVSPRASHQLAACSIAPTKTPPLMCKTATKSPQTLEVRQTWRAFKHAMSECGWCHISCEGELTLTLDLSVELWRVDGKSNISTGINKRSHRTTLCVLNMQPHPLHQPDDLWPSASSALPSLQLTAEEEIIHFLVLTDWNLWEFVKYKN